MKNNEPLAEKVRAAMRRTASGVAVLATGGVEGRAGITVSTLCSLSLEPPSVIACVHRDSRALGPIFANGRFSANILAEGQEHIAEAFAGFVPELRRNPFAAGRWRDHDGVPRLNETVAFFSCRLADDHAFGTHRIVIGEILDVEATDKPPLLYADRRFHNLSAA